MMYKTYKDTLRVSTFSLENSFVLCLKMATALYVKPIFIGDDI